MWAAWEQNLAQAELDLAGQDPAIVRTLAGYMTLGDYKSVGSVTELVEFFYDGTSIDPARYNRSMQRYLYWDADADNDGASNLEEWQAASPTGSLDGLALFAQYAFDGVDPPESAAKAAKILKTETQACGCDYCCDCTVKADVTLVLSPFSDPPGGTGYALVGPEKFCVNPGDTVTAPLGWMVELLAEPDEDDGYEFLGWAAGGSMADGSLEEGPTFMLMQDTMITPFFYRASMEIPHDSGNCAIEVEPHGGAFECEGEGGERLIKGPQRSTVTLTARSLNPAYRVSGWAARTGPEYADPRCSHTSTVTVRPWGYLQPSLASTADPAAQWEMVNLKSSQGGELLASTCYGWSGKFQRRLPKSAGPVSFSALPNPGWEFDHWEGLDPEDPEDPFVDYVFAASCPATVKAVFRAAQEYTIQVDWEIAEDAAQTSTKTVNTRTITPDCSPTCAGEVEVDPARFGYAAGDVVTITAQPNPGYRFVGWVSETDAVDWLDRPICGNPYNPLILVTRESGEWQNLMVTANFVYDPVILMQAAQDGRPARRILQRDDPATADIREDVATIGVAPQMPQLTASITNATANTAAQWQLTVSFDPDGQEEVPRHYPGPGADDFTPAGSAPWNIGAAFGNDFIGGNAVLRFRFCGRDTERLPFLIWGTNPSFAAITNELDDDKYRAISWHESAYRQFQPNPDPHRNVPEGGTIGPPLPCYAHDGGYGLMQITDPQPSLRDMWHWRQNVATGQAAFDQKLQQSYNHLAWWNRPGQGPPTPTPDPPMVMTEQQHLLNAFSLYRSGNYYWERELVPGTTTYELRRGNHVGCAYADARVIDMEERPWLQE